MSKEMMELVKAIGEARSKQEEDKIVVTEATKLKFKFAEQGNSEKRMWDLLIRSIYVEMLGHDGSFSHIQAINMAQNKNILSKWIGYLTSTLFLDKDNEMLILIIATLQRDLQSTNYLEISAALHTISRIANQQILLAVNEQVIRLLTNSNEYVWKKAVMVLHKFW